MSSFIVYGIDATGGVPPAAYLTGQTALMDSQGNLVWLQNFSDGHTQLINPDGHLWEGTEEEKIRLLPYQPKPLIFIKEFTINEVFENGSNITYDIDIKGINAGQLYDVAVAGVPSLLNYTWTTETDLLHLTIENMTASTIIFNQNITITIKKE